MEIILIILFFLMLLPVLWMVVHIVIYQINDYRREKALKQRDIFQPLLECQECYSLTRTIPCPICGHSDPQKFEVWSVD